MLTANELKRLANHGFTSQGAAIVDAIWFTTMTGHQIAIALICNPTGTWKAYIGVASQAMSEDAGLLEITDSGSKVPYTIAKAAFPERPFDEENYGNQA
jgi:hypothetical protein